MTPGLTGCICSPPPGVVAALRAWPSLQTSRGPGFLEAVLSRLSGIVMETEALLEAVAARQDRRAFAELFRAFAPRLKAHFLARRVSAATADELTQETMLRVWRNAGQFDVRRGAASTWLFTVARNCLIDLVRREKRVEVELDDPERAEPAPGADEVLVSAQSFQTLRRALGELPSEQAAVVEKAYFADQSLSEIAKATALPLGTVKSRARLALERLRATMGRASGD